MPADAGPFWGAPSFAIGRIGPWGAAHLYFAGAMADVKVWADARSNTSIAATMLAACAELQPDSEDQALLVACLSMASDGEQDAGAGERVTRMGGVLRVAGRALVPTGGAELQASGAPDTSVLVSHK